MQTDVFVVGAGPAGLAVAIAARLKGFDVAVADGARPPIDKACGEGILPAGARALGLLGLDLSSGFPIRGIRFVDGPMVTEVEFPSECGIALRRTRLHEMLATRAADLGVRLLWGTRVADGRAPMPCRWIVGADGQNSSVRRAAGLDAAKGVSRRFGFRRHHVVTPWTDLVEVHWGLECQVFVTPVSDREVGLAVLSENPHLRLDDALGRFPDLQTKLHGAEASSEERGAVTVSRAFRQVFRDNTVLVGDASGSVDAITGEGLSAAFTQAVALSEALSRDDVGSYQLAHSRLARRPALIEHALLFCGRSPRIRRPLFRALGLMAPMIVRREATPYFSGAS